MQAATQATLANLVESHVTALVRESAALNRHSRRTGHVSAGDDDADAAAPGGSGRRKRRRRLLHHDDVNLALAWRGSEKLYVSGVPLLAAAPPAEGGDMAAEGNAAANNGKSGLGRLLKATTDNTTVPSLLQSSRVPRVDLNAYLRTELAVRPPSELGLTLRWLAVDGDSPSANLEGGWTKDGQDVAPVLDLDDDEDDKTKEDGEDPSSIRIRELRHRLLSEELQLYYARVTSALESDSTTDAALAGIAAALHGLRTDAGIQELVPFLSRYVASGLLAKKNLHHTDRCRRLVGVFDALVDNRNVHLDLQLHQLFAPVGTCIVAKNLVPSGDPNHKSSAAKGRDDHWSLREEAARCLVKACGAYGERYATMKPRVIKLLTKQALRSDRPLATQYGGIVGVSLFGPRAVDAFVLPVAREYWERWEGELEELTNQKGPRDVEREYALGMCQRALLDAVRVFVQDVSPGEQGRRVDVGTFADVFGERLVPLRPEMTEYIAAMI